jgi:hypothetical protein
MTSVDVGKPAILTLRVHNNGKEASIEISDKLY